MSAGRIANSDGRIRNFPMSISSHGSLSLYSLSPGGWTVGLLLPQFRDIDVIINVPRFPLHKFLRYPLHVCSVEIFCLALTLDLKMKESGGGDECKFLYLVFCLLSLFASWLPGNVLIAALEQNPVSRHRSASLITGDTIKTSGRRGGGDRCLFDCNKLYRIIFVTRHIKWKLNLQLNLHFVVTFPTHVATINSVRVTSPYCLRHGFQSFCSGKRLRYWSEAGSGCLSYHLHGSTVLINPVVRSEGNWLPNIAAEWLSLLLSVRFVRITVSVRRQVILTEVFVVFLMFSRQMPWQ
jgi:hypothetical protein